MTQTNLKEVSVASDLYEQSLVVLETDVEEEQAAFHAPTYHTTPWSLVNRILDTVDRVTGGHAGKIQRFFTFAFLGGLASIVNLVVLFLALVPKTSLSPDAQYIIAFLLASEISIIVNFSLNDYFTFRHLPGHARTWSMRCVRFHVTSISGVILTFLISAAVSYGLHIHHVLAQAIAILIVLFYNFTVHHVFTYRHLKATV